ncbi:MAG: serine/threonine protein kinase [Acidobacteria bacterium]|nr:serine/threonine protein kinase [Acidobacteriota bacterium]
MTTPVDWNRLNELFAAALELPSDRRALFVEQECAGNGSLLRELHELLRSHDESSEFIRTPAAADPGIFVEKLGLPARQFGPYKVIDELGSGGMGAVYLAERTDGEFQQRVAIKIIRQTIAEEHLVERFKRERQILADLNHPNIATLLDGGVSPAGEPFLVMEFIDGQPIDEYARSHDLDLEKRLDLFLKVCRAVAFAHSSMVIHRDIKPANILVTASGEPKLLDFGLARILDESTSYTSDRTQTAFRALTPAYASPEQIRGEAVSTATDIYSLGVVLFELLTGKRPYQVEGRTLEQILKTVTDARPPKPSELGSRSISSDLKGDLDNIVLMALRGDPQRRYTSVESFASDIKRHIEGLPVSARPSTLAYRTERFLSRHRFGAAASALVLISILAGLGVSLWQARVAAFQRDQAQRDRARAEQATRFLQNILSAASPDEKGKDARVIEVLDDAAARIDTDFSAQPELRAEALLTIGQTYAQIGLFDQAERELRRALDANRDAFGEDSAGSASSKIYLGSVLMDLGRYGEAEDLLTQGVNSIRRTSPGSRDLAFGLNALGEFYVRAGRVAESRPLLTESVSINTDLFGDQSLELVMPLVSLGRAQQLSGDLDAAESTLRRALVTASSASTSRAKARLALTQLNLGGALLARGKFDEALSLLREANAYYEPQGASYFSFMAALYLATGYLSSHQYDAAIAAGRRADELAGPARMTETPDYALVLNAVGLSLTRTKRAAEGEPYLRRSLEKGAVTFNADNLYFLLIQGNLGECLTELGRASEAEPLLTQSYDGLKKTRGEKDALTEMARTRLERVHSVK